MGVGGGGCRWPNGGKTCGGHACITLFMKTIGDKIFLLAVPLVPTEIMVTVSFGGLP